MPVRARRAALRGAALLISCMLAGCAHQAIPDAGGATALDTTATVARLRGTDSALAAAAELGDASVVLSALEPSAAVLFPGQPILRGRDARPAFIARYGAPARYTWRPVHAVASADGRFGCTVGYSRFINPSDTVHAGHQGTYIACWRRADGTWRLAGLQRSDSPGEPPSGGDAAALAGAPHSATVSSGTDALSGARSADSAFAVMGRAPAGPGPAFALYAAEDGMLFSGAQPRGPAAISAQFEGFPAERVILWEPKGGFGAGSGGLAFTVGDAVSGLRSAVPGAGAHNKYLTVWRQEPDGRWKYLFDLGSSRP